MTFQVGDVVQLRYGGGPHIRVEKAVTSDDNEWVTSTATVRACIGRGWLESTGRDFVTITV